MYIIVIIIVILILLLITKSTIYYYYFNTTETIIKGLSNIKYLPFNHIAIFDFKKYSNHSMWMKETYIPLDMIFLDHTYKILGFVENTIPHSLKSLTIDKNSYYIIETNAGFINKYNLKIGDIFIDKFILINLKK